MKTFGRIIVALLILTGIIAGTFGLTWLGIEWDGFFGAKRENVRRNVFENTHSYTKAKFQELVKYKLEYEREKDPIARKAIASAVRMTLTETDTDKLPLELRSFARECLYGEK